jgi:hypothetical protein
MRGNYGECGHDDKVNDEGDYQQFSSDGRLFHLLGFAMPLSQDQESKEKPAADRKGME